MAELGVADWMLGTLLPQSDAGIPKWGMTPRIRSAARHNVHTEPTMLADGETHISKPICVKGFFSVRFGACGGGPARRGVVSVWVRE